MDGVEFELVKGHDTMPDWMPLQHPDQDFAAPHRDASAPVWTPPLRIWATRALTLIAALATTFGMSLALGDWLAMGGLGWVEIALIALVCFTFFWICFGVSTATVGLLTRRKTPSTQSPGHPMKVALLVPIYNEDVTDVMGNAAAMLLDLHDLASPHAFELFILSDTRDPDVCREEARAFRVLQRTAPLPVWYRRRDENIDRKTGNISDWIARWGGGYEAMVVLDADSLMSAEALDQLADEMSRDPAAGLIQSLPRLIGARTLFARLQQFSSAAYGWLLAEGLSSWAGPEGNYWGHNAIIRTRAFAECAGLPKLQGGGLILSHDFVEAGLLRRAGWAVRFSPNISGSYEESPASLVEYALRDRRWCHGNLQHLRLLHAKGFHLVSRFHMFAGAMAYLMAPAWFILLVIWALLGNGDEINVITYFTPANPHIPNWPEMSGPQGLTMLAFMYVMLLAPKLMAGMALALTATGYRSWGGALKFWGSFLVEIVAAILLAPVLMIQQLIAVLRCATGRKTDWTPLRRGGDAIPLTSLLRFHALETVLGVLLTFGLVAGLISLWLIPIAASLALAVPLSWASGREVGDALLATPETENEPRIVTMATHWRRRIGGDKNGIAAE